MRNLLSHIAKCDYILLKSHVRESNLMFKTIAAHEMLIWLSFSISQIIIAGTVRNSWKPPRQCQSR